MKSTVTQNPIWSPQKKNQTSHKFDLFPNFRLWINRLIQPENIHGEGRIGEPHTIHLKESWNDQFWHKGGSLWGQKPPGSKNRNVRMFKRLTYKRHRFSMTFREKVLWRSDFPPCRLWIFHRRLSSVRSWAHLSSRFLAFPPAKKLEFYKGMESFEHPSDFLQSNSI